MDSINRFRSLISDTINRKSENNHTKTDRIPRSLQEREMEAAIHIRGKTEIEKIQNIKPGSRIPTTPQNNNLTLEIKSDIQTDLETAMEDRLIHEDLPAQKPDRKPIDNTPTPPKNTHGSTPSDDLILDFPAPPLS